MRYPTHFLASFVCMCIVACGGGGASSPLADTVAPAVASASPAPASGMNAPTTSIVVSFSEAVNCSSVNANTIALSDGSTPLAGTTACSGNTITFSPALSLPTNTTLTASVNTTVTDLASNALASPYSWTFGVAPWTRQFGTAGPDTASAFTVDKAGNIYVAGGTSGNLDEGVSAGGAFLVKYDKFGTRQWIRQFRTAGENSASAMATDDAGNVYVGIRASLNADGDGYGMIVKYDSSGVQLWAHQLSDELFRGMATDPQGNLLAVGIHRPNQLRPDTGSFVVKYDSNGTVLWANQGSTRYPQGVATDSDGNLYVAVCTEVGYLAMESYLLKYDSFGAILSTSPISTGVSTCANAVAVDGNGNAYVAGWVAQVLDANFGFGNGSDAFVMKLDRSGTAQWTGQVGSLLSDAATSIAVDSAGNVVVGGATLGGLDGNTNADTTTIHSLGVYTADVFIVKYDSAGTKLWLRQTGTSREERLAGIGVDAAGNVYGAGYTGGGMDGNTNAGAPESDVFIVKYQADGTKR
jgi:hypothetical protein